MSHEPANELASDDDPLRPRRSEVEDPHFDITAMVDLVFMMNIFFLVTWVGAAMAEIDLPTARHCVAVDPEQTLIVTVLSGPDRQTPVIYLGEVRSSAKPIDPAEIDETVRAAVEKFAADGKHTVLIKAEKQVQVQHTARVATAAQAVEGTKVNLAVVEKE